MTNDWLYIIAIPEVILPGTISRMNIPEQNAGRMLVQAHKGKAKLGFVFFDDQGIVPVGCLCHPLAISYSGDGTVMQMNSRAGRRFQIICMEHDSQGNLKAHIEFFNDHSWSSTAPNCQNQDILSELALLSSITPIKLDISQFHDMNTETLLFSLLSTQLFTANQRKHALLQKTLFTRLVFVQQHIRKIIGLQKKTNT